MFKILHHSVSTKLTRLSTNQKKREIRVVNLLVVYPMIVETSTADNKRQQQTPLRGQRKEKAMNIKMNKKY